MSEQSDKMDIFWFGFYIVGLAYREYTEECVKMLGSLGMDISVSVYSGKMEEFVWEDLDPIRATWNHFSPT